MFKMKLIFLLTTVCISSTFGEYQKVTWKLKTSPVKLLPKYTTVFGVPVLASASTTASQFQHVASVLAAWLDNDQDGCVDNPKVLKSMLATKGAHGTQPKSSVIVPGKASDWNAKLQEAVGKAGYSTSAPLYIDEIFTNCSGPAATSACADATLEEVLHVITDTGYAMAWPKIFGMETTSNSKLTQAMDVARGGKFVTTPDKYPSKAWYTYTDKTYGYSCQANEYIYWAVSAWVGALAGRETEIKKEWRFNTRGKLVAGDKKMTAIIEDASTYLLPDVSPDGVYTGPSTCATGANHS